MKIQKLLLITLTVLLTSISTFSAEEVVREEPEDWGLGMGFRNAQIPFKTAEDSVADVVPLIFYKGDRLTIHGLSAGYRFIDFNKKSSISAITKYRFFDIPAEYQQKIRGSAFDFGFEYAYLMEKDYKLTASLLFDGSMRSYALFDASKDYTFGALSIRPNVYVELKSAEFNDRYYGLNIDKPGFGFSIGAGAQFKYHVWSNLHLLGNVEYKNYDNGTEKISTMSKGHQIETFIGIGLMKDKKQNKEGKTSKKKLKSKNYFRLGVAEATPSNISEIIRFHTRKDQYENTLMSFSYGHALSDTLFTLPIQMYLQPMYTRHQKSEVQDASDEFGLVIKAYLPIKWPFLWRIGFGEGISYVNSVTYIEGKEMVEKGYRESKMMNFLDVTVDFNLGSIFRTKSLDNSWIGAMIHHRSSIFESSSMFGRIKGGSNYIGGFYLHDF
jgi:outer membrane protein